MFIRVLQNVRRIERVGGGHLQLFENLFCDGGGVGPASADEWNTKYTHTPSRLIDLKFFRCLRREFISRRLKCVLVAVAKQKHACTLCRLLHNQEGLSCIQTHREWGSCVSSL
jgi:hypothetical protein